MGKYQKHPTVYWIRFEVRKAHNLQKREQDAGSVLQTVYRHPCVESASMVTDEGLINLVATGIHEAFMEDPGEESEAEK